MLKVDDMSQTEMHELLERQSFGHLGCGATTVRTSFR